MNNNETFEEIINHLRTLHAKYPEQRLGQLIENVVDYNRAYQAYEPSEELAKSLTLFYVTNEQLLEFLKEYAR